MVCVVVYDCFDVDRWTTVVKLLIPGCVEIIVSSGVYLATASVSFSVQNFVLM